MDDDLLRRLDATRSRVRAQEAAVRDLGRRSRATGAAAAARRDAVRALAARSAPSAPARLPTPVVRRQEP